MLKYFNKKEDARYLTFRRKRFITVESSRSKIFYDKKRKVLWMIPPGLVGQPLLMEMVEKMTYGVRKKTVKESTHVVGSIMVMIKGKKLLIYDIAISCEQNESEIKEQLLADLQEIINEVVDAFRKGI